LINGPYSDIGGPIVVDGEEEEETDDQRIKRMAKASKDPRIDAAVASVLCFFAYGYWGANKTRDDKGRGGIVMKIRGKKYNLTDHLNLDKMDQSAKTQNSKKLTASRIARIAVLCAFHNRGKRVALKSPLRKRLTGLTDEGKEAAYLYLQIHGYLLPLKLTNMKPEEKIACLGINFYVHYTHTIKEVREGVLNKFQNVMTLSNVDAHKVIAWIKANRGTATGMMNDDLKTFLKSLEAESDISQAVVSANSVGSVMSTLDDMKRMMSEQFGKTTSK